MRFKSLHPWDLTPTEAIALQRRLACRIDTQTPLTCCDLIAGADVSYDRFSPIFYAAVVVLRTDTLAIVEKQSCIGKSPFPYIPGLLSFREAPIVLEAFAKLKTEPDVVMIDGQGYSHPRRIGIASHIGLVLDRPTIGCAKSILVGKHKEPGIRAGSLRPLMDKEEVIGKALRTKRGVAPVFVSVGHKIDLASAVRIVLQSCQGFRIPEPTRQAHLFVNELRRAK